MHVLRLWFATLLISARYILSLVLSWRRCTYGDLRTKYLKGKVPPIEPSNSFSYLSLHNYCARKDDIIGNYAWESKDLSTIEAGESYIEESLQRRKLYIRIDSSSSLAPSRQSVTKFGNHAVAGARSVAEAEGFLGLKHLELYKRPWPSVLLRILPKAVRPKPLAKCGIRLHSYRTRAMEDLIAGMTFPSPIIAPAGPSAGGSTADCAVQISSQAGALSEACVEPGISDAIQPLAPVMSESHSNPKLKLPSVASVGVLVYMWVDPAWRGMKILSRHRGDTSTIHDGSHSFARPETESGAELHSQDSLKSMNEAVSAGNNVRAVGLGAYLLAWARQQCRGKGDSHLLLVHDDQGSGKLIKFYEHFGFVSIHSFIEKGMICKL